MQNVLSKKLTLRLLVAGLCLFGLALNISRAVRADYTHDEDQFITSARLLLDEGLLPYRDYPYFHTPYLVFAYAGLFALTGNCNLLAARLFSAVCATGNVMLVLGMVLYFFRQHSPGARLVAAASIVLLYLPNPLLASAAAFSWNHSQAVLLMLGSIWLALLSREKKAPGGWWLSAGVLLGIAVGVRASSLTLLPAFLLALFWFPGETNWQRLIRPGLLFLAGFIVALLPLLWIFLAAPQQFIFGNLGYAQLNATYRVMIPVAYDGNLPIYGPMSLGEKLGFLWNEVVGQPVNLLLFACLVFFGWSVLAMHLGRKDEHSFQNMLVLAAAPLAAIGSFLPTPAWYQYFYAPLPFALLAIALGLATLTRGREQLWKWSSLLLVELVLIANLYMLPEYRRMSFLRYNDLWKPVVIHQLGVDIQEIIGIDGRVLTLAPLYPLEGGLHIYAPLATGVFAYRTGSLLNEDQRQMLGILSAENIKPYMDEIPPDGILVGFDADLEQDIIDYALERGYQPQPLNELLTLWVKPEVEIP
jgi:4-amino-4-deoxy-L-arabinose transferase-like glycosyltransferase